MYSYLKDNCIGGNKAKWTKKRVIKQTLKQDANSIFVENVNKIALSTNGEKTL